MTERPPKDSPRAPAVGLPAGRADSLIHLPIADDAQDRPGDAPCWANRVCYECGRFNEDEHPEICQACGAVFD
jgi:hypothetical protein